LEGSGFFSFFQIISKQQTVLAGLVTVAALQLAVLVTVAALQLAGLVTVAALQLAGLVTVAALQLAGLVTVSALQLKMNHVLLPLVCTGVNECFVDDICARWQLSL
jgi:hypothetical protein